MKNTKEQVNQNKTTDTTCPQRRLSSWFRKFRVESKVTVYPNGMRTLTRPSNLYVDQLEMVQRRAARFAYSSVRYGQRLRLGTTSNPQTPWHLLPSGHSMVYR